MSLSLPLILNFLTLFYSKLKIILVKLFMAEQLTAFLKKFEKVEKLLLERAEPCSAGLIIEDYQEVLAPLVDLYKVKLKANREERSKTGRIGAEPQTRRRNGAR